MSGIENNGQRLPVVFGGYVGEAGICERGEGQHEVAFFADFKTLRKVSNGTIAGEPVEVIAIARSAFVTGMVVLSVKSSG